MRLFCTFHIEAKVPETHVVEIGNGRFIDPRHSIARDGRPIRIGPKSTRVFSRSA